MKHFILSFFALLLSFASFAVIAPITGSTSYCQGYTGTPLSDATSGGTWTSSNTAIITIGSTSGIVNAISAGPATITYTVGAGHVTTSVTVNPLPTVFSVIGGGTYCTGGSGVHVGMNNSTTGTTYQLFRGGTTTVGSPFPGTGTAVDFGAETVGGTYTVVATITATGCTNTMADSAVVSIATAPTAYTLYIGGSGAICAGSSGDHIYLSYSDFGVDYQLITGGTPLGAPVAGFGGTIDFGAQSVAGTYTAIGTNTTTGCTNYMLGSPAIYILPTPAAIGGPSSVCVGSTINLTETTTGGTWSSSSPGVANVGSTGIVTGYTIGSTTIAYTLPSGCAATTTINAINTLSPITGPTTVCTGTPTTLSDVSTGGTWTSTNTAVATIGSSSGTINGISAGVTTISYTVGGSCGAVTSLVTVNLTPAGITGITSICQGAVSTLSDVTTGGTWSSANTAVATIGSTSGIATSISSGSAGISYTVAGCSAGTNLTVDPKPIITGPTGVCATAFITLHTSINGSWTSSNPAVASVVTGFMAGTVTGVYPGTAVMTCNSYSTGCVSTYTVTVTSSCTGTPTAGTAQAVYTSLCSGNSNTLYLVGASTVCGISYQWQYSTDSLAWADLSGVTTDTATIYPEASLYYRCKLTCFSTGAYAYSAGVFVGIYNHITAQSIINTPSYFCNGPDFHLATCGIAPNTNIKTYYGDGTSDTTHLSTYTGTGPALSDIYHNYNLPGTYSVKQVLRDGITPQDSVSFSFSYNYCRTLPISFYFDANSDCIFDYGDGIFYQPVTTEVDSNGIPIDTITAINGFYYMALGDSGTIYEFKVLSYDTGLHMSCPGTGILYDTIGAYANTYSTKFFGFTCHSSSSFDLRIYADITCGRHIANGFIVVSNSYCDTVSPVVTMNFSPKYNFSSSWPAPYSVSGNTVTWHLPPLSVYCSPFGLPVIEYLLTIPGAFLVAGDTVNSNYKVTPYTGDVDTTNNYFARVDTIMASYDPNRIDVAPKGYVISCTPLMYTISFENTGNDTAHNISVIDTLPDNVDPATIKLVAASSVVNLVITKYGTHTLVKFDFPNINLPDSSHHNQCNGVVVFSVRAKQSLADGTTLFNHASIYFDDNLPVLTNSVENIIGISPITGPSTVCNTTQIQLNDESENGTWSGSNSNASVSSGLVTAMAAGMDTISYKLSNTCTSKTTTKVITINPIVVPAATIVSGTGLGDTVCDGNVPSFTVTPTNGGTSPTYNWQVNSTGSDTGSSFSYLHPANNDIISVTMMSNADCAIPDSATASIVLTVLTPYIPPVTLNAYPGIYIGPGMSDTFVATIPAGDPMPTYQWLVNGIPVAGATSDTFITHTLVNNDSVTCLATGTDLCHLTTFNSFIITVGNVGVKNISSKASMVLFPNPNKGTFTIKGKTGSANDEEINVEITNMLGQLVYRTKVMPQNGLINEQIQPDSQLPKGIYLLNARTGNDNIVFRFVVE